MKGINQVKFNIVSSFSLSSDDLSVISLLYSPLIGSEAVGLYLGLQSLLERNNLKSEEYIHQEIFDLYSLNEKSFLKARYQLEGIGLLVTYENDVELLYSLCPPLSAKNFIKDATLGLYLYSKVGKELFDKIYNHFKIEKIDKTKYNNVTKGFEEVFTSEVNDDTSINKFQYILGKSPKNIIKITNKKFNMDEFIKSINLDFLEMGVTKQFTDQIKNLAFVYAFDEAQMASLYNESINRSGLFDYRLLKKKANILYQYLHQMNAPKLVVKEDETAASTDFIDYLDNTPASEILEELVPNFPASYLNTINDIYSNIDLPRGVLNCMIIKVLKEKSGELPSLAYFKKVSESWIKDSVFTTIDAIKYVTKFEDKNNNYNKTKNESKYQAGEVESL